MNNSEKNPSLYAEFAQSAELYDISESIGNKFGLHIDQIGEFDAEVRDILNGVTKSSNFIDDLVERLEIVRPLAQQIAEEANTRVFEYAKSKFKSGEINPPPKRTFPTFSALENAGKFEIEKGASFTKLAEIPNYTAPKPASVPIPNVMPKTPEQTISDPSYQPFSKQQAFVQPRKINLLEDDSKLTKESVKNDMEAAGITIHDESKQEFMEHGDPAKQGLSSQHKVEPPANLPGEKEVMGMTNEHTDALVDQLLGQVASAIQEKIAKKPATPPLTARQNGDSDTYREPFV